MRFVCFALLTFAAWGARKPDHVPASIWVREDLFAGYLDGDMQTFGRGERKVDELLAEDGQSPVLRAWKLSAEFFRAVLAYESKDHRMFEMRYSEVMNKFESLRNARLQRSANVRAREAYLQLEQLQNAGFDKMPLHHRGEVLAGVAQSAARSGEEETSRKYLARIIETLPGTPYAAFAQTMLQQPDKMKTTRIACNSCHEPNRLKNHYRGEQ
jgi:hypothetical protein